MRKRRQGGLKKEEDKEEEEKEEEEEEGRKKVTNIITIDICRLSCFIYYVIGVLAGYIYRVGLFR